VAGTPAGTTSKIEFVRDGKVRTATTEIAAQEAPRVTAEAGAQAAPETVATVTLGRLGLTVAPLGAPSRNRAGSAATGVVVAGVEPGKGAAEKGLRVGDVITSINQKPVASPKDLAAAVEEASRADRKAVLLLVERDGEQRFVAVELADA
jgi:serine protease Do